MKVSGKALSNLKKNKDKVKKIQEREARKKLKAESDKLRNPSQSVILPKRMTSKSVAAVTSTHTR